MFTPQDVIAQLARGPDLLDGLLKSVPSRDLSRRPAPAKWSAHEHACHVALMEPMWIERLERIVSEVDPHIVSYEPADEDPNRLLNMNLEQAMQSFRHDRTKFVTRARELPESTWGRSATHTSHARYGLFLMCRHMVMHDALHGYRIEEVALGSFWPTEV